MAQHWFVQGDAYSLLRQWMEIGNRPISTIITSPPYYGCRDYLSDKNTLGSHHTGTDQLGHEDTPFAYVRNLSRIFGNAREAKYLRNDGSLWLVIGDTFARKDYIDSDYPIIYKGEAIGIDSLLINEMRRNGWRLHQKIIWSKPSVPPSGTVRKRCNPSHEYILIFYRESVRWFPKEIRELAKTPAGKEMPPVGGNKYGGKEKIVSDGMRSRQDVWTICPSRNRSNHVAPFPEEIPRLAILATTELGEIVCDCFAGTGTTGRVSVSLGRSCVSFDLQSFL